MENSDENDEETDKHAMAETSDKSGPETPKQTMKTSDENDQESSSHVDVCKICGKSFHSKYYLRLHIKTVHQGSKEFACDVCGKTFVLKGNLN